MGKSGQPPGGFAGTGEAIAAVAAGLAFVARADAASLPTGELADCLKALERAESVHTAARASVLSAFTSQAGFEDDGHRSAKSWLAWQTRITGGAAAGAVGWMRRLAAHPLVGGALADGKISASWARQVCGWSDLLPPGRRANADQILLAAAAGGATLSDLAGLAEEMYRRSAPPDRDHDDGFGNRGVGLDIHFRGAGKLTGDLTPECAAALAAVLESLGKKAGADDDRTRPQRDHDALEEACRRLAGSGCLPDRAGQPTQVQLHMTLEQLRSLDGAADAESAWAAARAAGDGEPGWVSSRAAAEGYACDAQIVPLVSGHIDRAALARMTSSFLGGPGRPSCTCGGCTCGGCTCAPGRPGTGLPGGHGSGSFGPGRPDLAALPPKTLRRLQDTLLRYAADVLSGPAGLAAFLRTGLLADQFPASVSMPLETGAPANTIPPHLRRQVISRDRHCAYAGCRQHPSACHIHHIIPKSRGGRTVLTNLILLCPFHHLVAIHRWGWSIKLNADGTTTATSPDGKRTLHSHSPPAATAA